MTSFLVEGRAKAGQASGGIFLVASDEDHDIAEGPATAFEFGVVAGEDENFGESKVTVARQRWRGGMF